MSDLKRHYLDDYAKEDFKEEYEKYLKDPNEACPYKDIDAVRNKNVDFYDNLVKFLNNSLGQKFKFEGPNKYHYPIAIKFQMDFSTDFLYLRSDQLGFSAPRAKSNACRKYATWNGEKSYPYAKYLSVNCYDDKGAADLEKRKFVASCIYETRTIGGSFIWPIVNPTGKWKSQYNIKRGIRGYIEDRVDITLYEISRFYDVYSPLKNYNCFEKEYTDKYKDFGNILFIRQCEEEKKAIYQWLSIFETFKGYVEKLKFKDFVIQKEGKYLIRDMANKDTSSVLDITKIKKIREMNPDELHTLLVNVKESTESRSEAIEKELNN